MSLSTLLTTDGVRLPRFRRRRIEHQLEALARRLAHHPDPTASLVITESASGPHPAAAGHGHEPSTHRYDVRLRVQLGPLGRHLVSHHRSRTPDRAARLAIEDVERQLERVHAFQRGYRIHLGAQSTTLSGPEEGEERSERSEEADLAELNELREPVELGELSKGA